MTKKLVGTVVEWDAARGFGFLQSGSARIFLHRREFFERRKVIELGDRVSFTMGVDAEGRSCAKEAGHVRHGGSVTFFSVFVLVGLLILPGFALSQYPAQAIYVGGYLVGINFLTILFYTTDKNRARDRRWRIPETRLHFLELLGGWPAAFLAQRILRHKISKGTFQFVFWSIVVLHQVVAWDVIRGGTWTRNMMGESFRFLGDPGR